MLVVGDSVLAPLLQEETLRQAVGREHFAYVVGTGLSPVDAYSLFEEAVRGGVRLFDFVYRPNEGERAGPVGGWRSNFDHIVFCISDSFELCGGTQKEGKIGVFLSQLSTLSLGLPNCFPEMEQTRIHIASPIVKPDLTPQHWARHLMSRQWLLEEAMDRYEGKILAPVVCSGEVASPGHDENHPVDNCLPASEDVFTSMPNARRKDLGEKMGIYTLRERSPRPSPIPGMFEDSRTLSVAGANKWKKVMIGALAKLEQRTLNTLIQMSMPSSKISAQTDPPNSGGMDLTVAPLPFSPLFPAQANDNQQDMDVAGTEETEEAEMGEVV